MLEILETQDFSGPLNSVAVVGGCTPHKDGWMLAEVDFTSPSGDFTLVVECAHYGSDRLDIIDVTAPAGSLHVLAKLFDSEPPSEAEMAYQRPSTPAKTRTGGPQMPILAGPALRPEVMREAAAVVSALMSVLLGVRGRPCRRVRRIRP